MASILEAIELSESLLEAIEAGDGALAMQLQRVRQDAVSDLQGPVDPGQVRRLMSLDSRILEAAMAAREQVRSDLMRMRNGQRGRQAYAVYANSP